MLRALNMPAKAALGFILATGFIADTGSLPLVVSNLVNIVSADYFGLGFAEYAAVMVPVGIVSVLASLGMLLAYFGRSIPKRYDVLALTRPAAAVKDRATFRAGWVVLAVLLIGYFAADPLGFPSPRSRVSARSSSCSSPPGNPHSSSPARLRPRSSSRPVAPPPSPAAVVAPLAGRGG